MQQSHVFFWAVGAPKAPTAQKNTINTAGTSPDEVPAVRGTDEPGLAVRVKASPVSRVKEGYQARAITSVSGSGTGLDGRSRRGVMPRAAIAAITMNAPTISQAWT